jgi:hypothetical protein
MKPLTAHSQQESNHENKTGFVLGSHRFGPACKQPKHETKKQQNKVKHMIQTKVEKTGRRRHSLALLLVAMLGPLAAAQANTWSFNLINEPTALNEPSPFGEFIRMAGAGTFDPDQGTVQASGSATVFNAFDHPLGPTLRDTWHATGFISFEADEGSNTGHLGGSLTIMIELDRVQGGLVVNAILNVMEDGITVDFLNDAGQVTEHYTTLPGGSALFHLHGKAEVP